ncbi:MAG: hypothetical protein Q9167_006189 [Letrouitia subvulpina]
MALKRQVSQLSSSTSSSQVLEIEPPKKQKLAEAAAMPSPVVVDLTQDTWVTYYGSDYSDPESDSIDSHPKYVIAPRIKLPPVAKAWAEAVGDGYDNTNLGYAAAAPAASSHFQPLEVISISSESVSSGSVASDSPDFEASSDLFLGTESVSANESIPEALASNSLQSHPLTIENLEALQLYLEGCDCRLPSPKKIKALCGERYRHLFDGTECETVNTLFETLFHSFGGAEDSDEAMKKLQAEDDAFYMSTGLQGHVWERTFSEFGPLECEGGPLP